MCFLYLLRIVFSCKKHQRQPRAHPERIYFPSRQARRKAGLGWHPRSQQDLRCPGLWLGHPYRFVVTRGQRVAEEQGGPSPPLKGTRCLESTPLPASGWLEWCRVPGRCSSQAPVAWKDGHVHSALGSSGPAGGESGSGGPSWLNQHLSKGWQTAEVSLPISPSSYSPRWHPPRGTFQGSLTLLSIPQP